MIPIDFTLPFRLRFAMRFLFSILIFRLLVVPFFGETIIVPSSETMVEVLNDLNGVIERKGDVVALMNLYPFEKKFEEWDELDFVLFQNAIKRYIHEGNIEKGPKYPNHLSQKFPLILAELKATQKQSSMEANHLTTLKEFQEKIYTLGRDFESGRIQSSSFETLQELRVTAEKMELNPGGEPDRFRHSILLQITSLQEKQASFVEGTKKLSHQQEIDRLQRLQNEKAEHRMMLFRWAIFAVIAFLFLAFWWSKQQGVEGTDSH